MSITFKAHGGFDAPWFVVPDPQSTDLSDPVGHAHWQKFYLIAAFGLQDVEGIHDRTLHEVAVICEPLWSGTNNVASLLGGTPVAEAPVEEPKPAAKPAAKRAPAKKAAPAPAADVQVEQKTAQEATSAPLLASEPEPQPEVPDEAHEFQEALDAIAAADSKKVMQGVLQTYRSAFQNADVQTAARAKLKELS